MFEQDVKSKNNVSQRRRGSRENDLFLLLNMATIIRSFADLHLLKDALTSVDAADETVAMSLAVGQKAIATAQVCEPVPLLEEDSAALAELEALLKRHDYWLGYSPIKGWALLDRKHPTYKDWNRPFVLLRDSSIDRLSREEFSKEPQGPWALRFWKSLDSATRHLAGPASILLTEVRRYTQEAERSAVEQNEDLATRIGEPLFSAELYFATGLEFQEKWAEAKRDHYAAGLPGRVRWLRGWAKRIQVGSTGLEPAWSRGIAAAGDLQENGIHHLWHFTDARNLCRIRREGGLLSWAGLSALGITDAHLMADDYSRSCDARLGRERYVRLSFIPNSWFFHRVRWKSSLVWLRFSMQTLGLGEVFYALGNAASNFVTLQDNLASIGINWEMIRPFCGRHTGDKGPTVYQTLFPDKVGDPVLFREISNAWNSEILIKDFLPFEYCDGVFDCRTGERILI